MNLTECCTAASTLLRNARGLASGSSRNTRRRNTRRSRHSLAPADILEPRLLLAGDATLDSAGKLTVTGTADNDIITVSILSPSNSPRQTQVAINSSSFSFDAVLVKSIHVSAGAGNDRITVSATVNSPCSLFGQDGDDVLIAGSGADQLFGGAGNDTMTGGNGDDRYVLEPAAGTERDTVSEADYVGVDTIDFSSLTESLVFSLATSAWQSAGTGRTLQLNARDRFENLIGGTGNDTLTGNALANQLSGGPGNDSLFGGLGNDTYLFQPAETPETDFISEALNAGSDTVDFSAITDNLTFAINTNAIQPAHLGRSLQLNAGDRIENVIGCGYGNRLTGNALNNVLQGGYGSDELIGGAGNDTLVGSYGNDILVGGQGDDLCYGMIGDDTYIFHPAVSPEADIIFEPADGGIETLNFTSCILPVTLRLNTSFVQQADLFRTLQLNSPSRFENAVGGSGNDHLTGNTLANSLTGGPGADMLEGGPGNDRLNGGSGSDELRGDSGDDLYVFSSAVTAEADFLVEQANSGIDTLDFSGLSQDVELHLGTSAIQPVHAFRTLQLNAADRFENAVGGIG
ncbi:MAG: M10 family metallopeptidase C-terminal domain-containing protein, partial [Planctomyces sp.]